MFKVSQDDQIITDRLTFAKNYSSYYIVKGFLKESGKDPDVVDQILITLANRVDAFFNEKKEILSAENIQSFLTEMLKDNQSFTELANLESYKDFSSELIVYFLKANLTADSIKEKETSSQAEAQRIMELIKPTAESVMHDETITDHKEFITNIKQKSSEEIDLQKQSLNEDKEMLKRHEDNLLREKQNLQDILKAINGSKDHPGVIDRVVALEAAISEIAAFHDKTLNPAKEAIAERSLEIDTVVNQNKLPNTNLVSPVESLTPPEHPKNISPNLFVKVLNAIKDKVLALFLSKNSLQEQVTAKPPSEIEHSHKKRSCFALLFGREKQTLTQTFEKPKELNQ